MAKKIVLTPEWVLEKVSHTRYADGAGNISVYTGNATDANWIELALDSLNIEFEAYDYLNENSLIVFGFDFRVEDIINDCPIFYHRMKELDKTNKIYKNSLKN